MIRHSSTRFSPRYDHSYPEHGPGRTPRITRRKLVLLPVHIEPRTVGVERPAGEVRR